MRILAGEDSEYTGSVKYGAGIITGYFSQDEAERITGSETIMQLMEREAPTHLIPKLYDMLAAFLFRGDDIHKQLSVLSGGEKSRLALLRLLLKPLNLLILDEPTNHLDLHSKDVLLDALQRFEGTVIFVSHDKFFIQGLATRVLELTASATPGAGTRIRNFPGTYDYYLYRIAAEAAGSPAEKSGQTAGYTQFSKSQGTGSSVDGSVSGKAADSSGGGKTRRVFSGSASGVPSGSQAGMPVGSVGGALSYEEQKKLRAEKRKREKEEERIFAQLAEIENKIRELEAQLANPEVYTDGEKARSILQQIHALQATSAELTEQWEALAQDSGS